MSVRTILFWMHLVTGVVGAIIVFLMSVTGVALTYQRQLTDLANRDYRSEAAPPGTPASPSASTTSSPSRPRTPRTGRA